MFRSVECAGIQIIRGIILGEKDLRPANFRMLGGHRVTSQALGKSRAEKPDCCILASSVTLHQKPQP